MFTAYLVLNIIVYCVVAEWSRTSQLLVVDSSIVDRNTSHGLMSFWQDNSGKVLNLQCVHT